MKVLVTGNQGYVGSVLVPYLKSLDRDRVIDGIDTGFFADCITSNSRHELDVVDTQYRKDIRDIEESELANYDAVIHLAAISNDPIGKEYADATHSINLLGTVRLAKLAKRAGVKQFILASSCSVYGISSGAAVDEEGKLNPLTEYAKSKIQSEIEIAEIADEGFKATFLRFGTACGYSPRTRLDLVVNDFVASAITTNQIYLLSKGNAWRPFIHVEDMARAFDWAITRDGESVVKVNVGSDEMTVTVSELAAGVSKIISDSKVVYDKDAVPDKRSYRVDFSKYRRLAPQHQPQWKLNAVINEFHDEFTKLRFDDPKFRQGDLIRLNMLKKLKGSRINSDLHWIEND